jgi:hypothetical protein
MRIDAGQIEERQVYIVGGIILNHLVSAINALRLARAHNRRGEELSWRFDAGYNPKQSQFSLGISKSF